MSHSLYRLSRTTGSLLILAAGSTTVSASLLGGLLDGSTDDSTAQTEQTSSQDGYSEKGTFSAPFAEPTIIVDGEAVRTDEKCITRADGMDECKPAAGTMALLRDGRLLYLNALEGTENVELSIVAEFGEVSVNDQTRVLSLDENDTPSWLKPSPLDAGANPDEPLNSGRNVVQTETYNPCAGTWAQNPSTADRSLPLYPRMHLLPNGHIFYNAGGQAFNPFDQGYDQALWNITASYNPHTQSWTDIGYAGLPLRLDEVGLAELSSTLNISSFSLEQASSLLGDLLESPTDLLESGSDLGVSEDELKMAG